MMLDTSKTAPTDGRQRSRRWLVTLSTLVLSSQLVLLTWVLVTPVLPPVDRLLAVLDGNAAAGASGPVAGAAALIWLLLTASAVGVLGRASRSEPHLARPVGSPTGPQGTVRRSPRSSRNGTLFAGGIAVALVLVTVHLTLSQAAFVATSGTTSTWSTGTWVAPPGSETFTGVGTHSFEVPEGHHTVRVEAWGAQGGREGGGRGGRVRGDIEVTPGETLTVRVGGQATGPNGRIGGFNGGGNGGWDEGPRQDGGGGGGASDVRRGGDSLGHRVLVAGGGGGGSVDEGSLTGGTGGGNTGGAGGGERPGGGGTQTAGGVPGPGGNAQGGASGQGGAGSNTGGCGGAVRGNGGGGGGGYFGGGGGGTCGGGGGGSGFTAAGTQNVQMQNGVRTGNGHVTIEWGWD